MQKPKSLDAVTPANACDMGRVECDTPAIGCDMKNHDCDVAIVVGAVAIVLPLG